MDKFLKEVQKGFPPLLRRGVLSVSTNKEEEKENVYFVELVEESNNDSFVTIYNIQPNVKPPVKAYETIFINQGFSNETVLGKLANMVKPTKEAKTYKDKPPIFMAPVVDGYDTFTGGYTRGFYDRAPDKITHSNAGVQVIEGKRTGVFLGLDLIEWQEPVILTDSILDRYNINKAIWFNLE